ncbi:DUF2867 domain-containing protein [uncultured Roseobacter sp.]|uniref:DUF2867 domain-containing protein n=1 Tax=uncultured Roseobacter sp. TaxID=114847 RepID=UPI002615C20C|nr:DUF2867 domain-containing protein [uncultured Roseobacter sp.]
MPLIQVEKTDLPDHSALHAFRHAGDFLDCYRVASDLPPRAAAGVIVAFPAWARVLVVLRNVLTAPFGLRPDGPESPDKLGPFPVTGETEDEVIAGFDDRHLNFRVGVLSTGSHVFLSTWVRPHHNGGRLYLAAILPFHIMIVRNALTRVAKQAAPGPRVPAQK